MTAQGYLVRYTTGEAYEYASKSDAIESAYDAGADAYHSGDDLRWVTTCDEWPTHLRRHWRDGFAEAKREDTGGYESDMDLADQYDRINAYR